ncbi:MAG: aminotransferase class I/II-fold pyridoxal phosphate-dependent enzyme [Duncaniella sp.]|nr:aminotransferase class I/II-fold pyridoxal phosphate-dependent enzyme [Duncaniella sp.]
MKEIVPARRVADIKEYYFSIKLKEVAAMRASGIDVISLGVGGPDRSPSEEVIETLREQVLRPDAHGYQLSTGLPELRRAWARWYRKWYGVDLDPVTEVLPLIGSKEGVLHISMAFLNEGDGVLVPDPGYPTYSSASRIVGARIVKYGLTEANGWQPDWEAIEKQDLSGVKLMWMNYPHMPTGAKASMETFHKAVEFGKRHGIVIVNDNPYSFILNDHPRSILEVEGAKDICIEMNSLSKSHNMPGWRVGVAISNPRFIGWILKVKSNVDSGQFRPLMQAAVRALDAPAEWYKEVNSVYADRRRIAGQIMESIGCEWDPAQSGLFLWGRIADPAVSSEQLADRLLKECAVFVTPGFIFGANGARYMRISLCAPEDRMLEALERIKTSGHSSQSQN